MGDPCGGEWITGLRVGIQVPWGDGSNTGCPCSDEGSYAAGYHPTSRLMEASSVPLEYFQADLIATSMMHPLLQFQGIQQLKQWCFCWAIED